MGEAARRPTQARVAGARVPGLSNREAQVLELLTEGLSNEGIAKRLFITSKSVESVLSSVFLKLGFTEDGRDANRRVKAAVHFALAHKRPPAVPLGLDAGESLMGAAPFDTISTVFEQRAGAAGTGAWRLLAAGSWCLAIVDELPEAVSLARRAHRLATDMAEGGGEAGWRTALLIVDGLVGTLTTMLGDAPIPHLHLDRIMELATRPPADPQRVIFDLMEPVLEIANWFTFGDRARDAAAILDRQLHDPGRLDHFAENAALGCLVELDIRRGRWTRCDRSLGVLFERELSTSAPSGYAHSLAARLHAGRGDHVRTRSHLRSARAGAMARADHSTQWRADAAEGLLLLGCGDYVRAAAVLSQIDSGVDRRVPRLPSVRVWDADLVECELRSGDPAAARRSSERLRADVQATGSEYGDAALHRVDGLLAGDGAAAVAGFESSAAIFARLDAPFEQARSELLLAQHLARVGRLAAAEARAARAAVIFEALGAAPWLRQCTHWGTTAPAPETTGHEGKPV